MVAPLAMMGLSAAADILGGVVDAVTSSAKGGGTPSATAGRDKIRKTAQDFESVFLEQTFDRLVSGSEGDGPLGSSGTGGGVYRSMLVKEYAGEVVKSGGVGIADAVYKQMLKLQEGANG